MATVKYKTVCELCGQPVKIKGFTLTVDNSVRAFCCAGCQSIYKLIYVNNQGFTQALDSGKSKTNNQTKEEN